MRLRIGNRGRAGVLRPVCPRDVEHGCVRQRRNLFLRRSGWLRECWPVRLVVFPVGARELRSKGIPATCVQGCKLCRRVRIGREIRMLGYTLE